VRAAGPGGREVALDLAHALVVKHHRRAAGGHEDRHAVADHECVGVVHLEAVAIDQSNGEGPEGRSLAEGAERFVEEGRLHWVSSQAGGRNLNHSKVSEYTPVQILVKDLSLLLCNRRAETKGGTRLDSQKNIRTLVMRSLRAAPPSAAKLRVREETE
jgi:hypothetical protein